MSAAKRDVIAKQVRIRIRSLAVQSYALLALMSGLIFYGFLISGRALETTNADLQDVRQSAERVRITSELERTRFRVLDVGSKFDKQFTRAQVELEKAIGDIIKPSAEKLGYRNEIRYFFQTYFFRT